MHYRRQLHFRFAIAPRKSALDFVLPIFESSQTRDRVEQDDNVVLVLDQAPAPGWYAQLLGDPADRGTSALAGRSARLFINHSSAAVITFTR